MTYKYKRVLLKLSGEGFSGGDKTAAERIIREIKELRADGIQVAIMTGGGNIIRGGASEVNDKPLAHQMGMLAIVINGLALVSMLEDEGVPVEMMSGLFMPEIAQPFSARAGRKRLDEGRVLVLVAGTGRPFLTSDTTAAMRAGELQCDALLKMTQVDGIYSADPKKDPSATRYDKITYDEVLAKGLTVMDVAAMATSRETGIPTLIFKNDESLKNILQGNGTYSIVQVK